MVKPSKGRASDGGNEVLDRLFAAIDCWDPQLAERAVRVSRTVSLLARDMGMSIAETSSLESAARVYDLGMLGIPADLRRNSGSNLEAKKLLRTHVTVVERILGKTASGGPSLRLPLEMAASHHERWDGGGYPQGLGGDAIPQAARMVAVAEALDLLVNPEKGNPGLPVEEAVAEVTRHARFAFDPAITDALQRAAIGKELLVAT